MMKVNTILTLCIGLMTSFILQAQYVNNPSFEGIVGMSISPPGWSGCNPESTPDTQPGVVDVFKSASDGETYVGLVMRGNEAGPSYAKNEGIQTQLLQPLLMGTCYRMMIDLANSDEAYESGLSFTVSYREPPYLRIWGGNSTCDKAELLMESELITNNNWETYEFILHPQQSSYTYLIMETFLSPRIASYLLLDNLKLDMMYSEPISLVMDTVIRPDDHILLPASEALSYYWQPAEGLNCIDCQAPQVDIETSTTYYCQLVDLENCPFTEVFEIRINVFIPNVFTPDGDGYNDFFRVDGLEPNSSLLVFNSLGRMVYQNNNYQNDWFGFDKGGSELSSDTYWYVLNIPGKGEYKGFVYLKK